MHFLGGSFTYRPNPSLKDTSYIRNIIVEIRLHISDHYFMCSPEQINDHEMVYLIGEKIPWDDFRKQYAWMDAEDVKRNRNFYRISCISDRKNRACHNFLEDMWALCEGANQKMGYSILIRQFRMTIDRFSPIELAYSACCWANSTGAKVFKFSLSIETNLQRINHSPYPYIPASYYVDYNNPQDIKVFATDLDGDEIVCENYDDTLGGFLTIRATESCQLIYEPNRLGKQFGQFWIMDRFQNKILTRSLISVQIQVLKSILCKEEPELYIRHGQHDNKDRAKTNVNQPVYLTVTLRPRCLLIQPGDQTITELTKLCSNSPPVILANGGIEVKYRCQPLLCDKQYVCFIGEFSLKLRSTTTKCFIIEAEGSESECNEFAHEYNRLAPRNRNYVIEEPVTQGALVVIPSKPATAVAITKSSSSTQITTTIKPKEESNQKTLIFVILGILALLGLIGFIGWKLGFMTWIQQAYGGNQNRPSNISRSKSNVERSTLSTEFDQNALNTDTIEYPLDDTQTPHHVKVRTQHVQLGPLDEDEL